LIRSNAALLRGARWSARARAVACHAREPDTASRITHLRDGVVRRVVRSRSRREEKDEHERQRDGEGFGSNRHGVAVKLLDDS